MRLTELLDKQRVRATGKKRYRLIYALALLLLGGGLLAAKESGSLADLRMRRELVREGRNIAATVSLDEIKALSFCPEDADRPAFQRLSSQFRAYAREAGLRSLYTLALRGGNLVFGPESLLPDDPYASPPGSVYQQPSEKDFEVFETGKVVSFGPITDEFGSFVTALVPIHDPDTGQVLMTVGVDAEASVWKARIRQAQWRSFAFFLLPTIFLMAGYAGIKYRQRYPKVRLRLTQHTETITCAVVLLLLTWISVSWIHRAEVQSRKDIFDSLAQTKAHMYTDAFKDIRTGLNLLARFFESSEHVSRNEFHAFCGPLLRDTSIAACVWLPEVPADGTATFEKLLRGQDRPDFTIRSSGERSPQESLYPVLYLSPGDLKRVIGFDLYSLDPCRAAMKEALQTGRISASDPVKLTTCAGEPLGIFAFQPASNPQQKGIAGAVIYPELLVSGPLKRAVLHETGLSASLFQLSPEEEPFLLACTRAGCTGTCRQELSGKPYQIFPVFAFGKTYSLLIFPEQQWMEEYSLPGWKTALLTGILLSVLLTTLVAILINRPALLAKTVQRYSEQLRESESRFGELALRTRTLLWETDTEGCYTYVNEAVKELLGYRPEELIGRRHYYDLHPEEDREAFIQKTFEIVRRKETFQNLENPVCTRRGDIIWVFTTGYPVLDEAGNVVAYRGSDTDMTERKEAERILREQEERLRTTLRSIGDAVISTDKNGRVVSLNPIAEDLTGWNQAEAAGQPLKKVFRIINEQTRKPVESPADRVLKAGIIVDLANHTLLLNKNGLEIPIADSGAPIQNESGEITGVVLVFRDQTKERNARRVLEESEEKYRQLFDNMTSGFALHEMLYDKAGHPADYRFLTVNPAFERLTGLRAEELIGRTVKEALPQTEAVWIERYGKVVQTGDPVEFEEYSGSLDRWFDIKAFRPSPGCFAVIFSDITGQKKSEMQLKEYLDELERFNRSAVGRELRMVELKKEINDLCRELGRKMPYPVNH